MVEKLNIEDYGYDPELQEEARWIKEWDDLVEEYQIPRWNLHLFLYKSVNNIKIEKVGKLFECANTWRVNTYSCVYFYGI